MQQWYNFFRFDNGVKIGFINQLNKTAMKLIRQFISFIVKWLWKKPTEKERLKATDVCNEYQCVEYKGQLINLKKTELPMWEAMARSDKRAMALKFKKQQEKGYIKFIKINGQDVCVKNKDYET